VKLATFNVLHGRPMRKGQPFALPAAAAEELLAGAVASVGADILALQEVDRLQERSGQADQAVIAARALDAKDWRYASALHGRAVRGKGWVHDPAEPGLRVYGPGDTAALGGTASHGIALLTRLPVRTWHARRFAPAPVRLPLRVAGRTGLTFVADQPRAALAAVVEGERGPFTVVAVHLSFVPGWNVGQLAAIRRWVADLPTPHVMLGDFNMVGQVPRMVLAGATWVNHATRRGGRDNGGWRDLARTPTYPSHRPTVQFDHVLAAGFSADAVRQVSTPPMPISDHRPLVVELTL
jgi:endonuclease/exonuclease/phosphatase family metal-dependent hydrolase